MLAVVGYTSGWVRTSTRPVSNGVTRLSFSGHGRLSMVVVATAARRAKVGVVKKIAPQKAKKKQETDPSRVFPLLKGNVLFPKAPPKTDAMLSPKQNAATATLLTDEGNISRVKSMPNAKNIGAVANSYSSGWVAAARVTDETTGKLALSILFTSDSA